MTTFLIGHRGVGKSSLLQRLKKYFASSTDVLCLDLDEMISKKSDLTVDEIFQQKGEEYFRKLEIDILHEILRDSEGYKKIFVALGAGFQLERLSKKAHYVWVRRQSDQWGRIFMDRPRLEKETTPLEEFHLRAQRREVFYRKMADEILFLPEGGVRGFEFEKYFFIKSQLKLGGVLTLNPSVFVNEERARSFLEKRLQWGIDFFELRTDWLNPAQMELAREIIPKNQQLIAIRNRQLPPRLQESGRVDWALELGEPEVSAQIVSIHTGTFSEAKKLISHYESHAAHVKIAVEVNSWKELSEGHEWVSENLAKRSFLPMSKDGRWAWYRLWMKSKLQLNFFREDEGSALDQPLAFAWSEVRGNEKSFAAVLGSPILHSWTPVEQKNFFSERRMPVFAIDLNEDDFTYAMPMLEKWGLRAAAVTSPLKKKAVDFCHHRSIEASELGAINTLAWDSQKKYWVGENTDIDGLQSLLREHTAKKVSVWGGGGVISSIQKMIPQAQFYSARSGRLRTDAEIENSRQTPQVLVWAAPRMNNIQFPPENWRPEVVIDLNYREDSLGREYALMSGAKYVSGIMFTVQAEGQRRFWSHYL